MRLRKTLAFLLRHRPDVGGLTADDEGWFKVDDVVKAVGRIAHVHLTDRDLVRAATQDPHGGFVVDDLLIRAGPRRRRKRPGVPDIVYVATTRAHAERARQEAHLSPDGRNPLRFHVREQHAWLAAHRARVEEPVVLYVDASRAARAGVVFHRLGTGVYGTDRLPVRFVLNLRPNFGVQASAGGFLVRRTAEGRDEVALIRVRRRSGVTWEVAKGKMEMGETPVDTAIRELQEEMGLDVPLDVAGDLGVSHYGFSTPAGEPRLKVLYLFVLRARGPITSFQPALDEGIEAIGFFDPEDAARMITHGSLREPFRRLRGWLMAQREVGGRWELDGEDPAEE